MAQGLPVPQYYVMPQETFCRNLGNSLGVNVAEFEFPAYYNFFLKVNTYGHPVEYRTAVVGVEAIPQRRKLG